MQEAEYELESSEPGSEEYIQKEEILFDAQRRRDDVLLQMSQAQTAVIVAQSTLYTATSQFEEERIALATKISTLETTQNIPFASITALASELATARINRDNAYASVVEAQTALDAIQPNRPNSASELDKKIEELNIKLPGNITRSEDDGESDSESSNEPSVTIYLQRVIGTSLFFVIFIL
jgi:reverse gyrase